MSCAFGRPTFRLLDRRVGWTDGYFDSSGQWVQISDPQIGGSPTPLPVPLVSSSLTSWNDAGGIRFLPAGGVSGANVIDAESLLASLPPHRLAPGCGPGSWLLLAADGNVLRRDPYTGCWHPLWSKERMPEGLQDARAIAASRDRFAIVSGVGVQVWTAFGEKQVAAVQIKDAVRVAFSPDGDLLVATQPDQGPITLHRYGPAGNHLGHFSPAMVTGPLDRLAVDSGVSSAVGESIWIATGHDTGPRSLWRGVWNGAFDSTTATATALASAFPATGLTSSSKVGFCLQETGPDGVPVTLCCSWDGCPIPESSVPPPPAAGWQTNGSITSGWIDSGIPRCRWHRIRVDAVVPRGTAVEVRYVATDFNPSDATNWEAPAPTDWQSSPPGALDLLMQQTTGQYLKLQLNFTGDGANTPVVWSVRIDFPRRTSLDRLPAFYRANPDAEDFTERFLANFDASIEDIDAAIARFPAMLAAGAVRAEVLPWLGSFLDVAFDPAWPDSKRRQILHHLPKLYTKRGTVGGLAKTFELIFDGVKPAISELAAERSWGALADSRHKKGAPPRVQPNAQVGVVRLFGKAKARFRLGHSALGAAPIHAYGNPDLDPLVAEAYRFDIQIPRGPTPPTALEQARMKALIDSQKPAHTAATIRFAGDGFVVGVWSAVGVDTAFTPPPPSVLGAAGNVRLRRASLVAAGPLRGRLPMAVSVSSVVGVQTLLE
jgi:phage tail-like protein